MKKKEVPVLLITGYLGSGKTTLVNRILCNEHGYRFAVLVNDLGEVNVDQTLIEQGGIVAEQDDSLVALQNGCICCTLKVDLARQLCTLASTHRFDYIVVEASGICEPLPIAQTICSIPYMNESFVGEDLPVLDCVVTVVDALRMVDEFATGDLLLNDVFDEEDITSLVVEQIEFCNIILLNKASMVTPEELNRLRAIVAHLQPSATIIPCDYGDVELSKIVNTRLFSFDDVASSATWIHEIDHPDEGHDHHHDETEEHGVSTFVYRCRRPMDITLFDHFVARRYPSGIIRAKGLCYFTTERDTCYLFSQAGRQIELRNCGRWYAAMPPSELSNFLTSHPQLQQEWDATYGDRRQEIVFIGQHLNTKQITHELDKCLTN